MKIQDNFSLKGEFTITKREVPSWLISFEEIGMYDFVKHFSKIISVHSYQNLICNTGRYTILDRMAQDTAQTGYLTYLALGSDDTAANAADTTLGTETFRKLLTSGVRNGSICETSTYLSTLEGDGTYKELGLFGDDATGVVDIGTLYTHQIIDETKSVGESLTIDYNITFN